MAELYSWNPRKKLFYGISILSRIPVYRNSRINNFGDLIGPIIIDKILNNHGVKNNELDTSVQILSVGSVISAAKQNAVIWGTGVNKNIPLSHYSFTNLDVRATRGPLTRAYLLENFGIKSPEIYGDPALLLPILFQEKFHDFKLKPQYELSVIPHFNDIKLYQNRHDLVNPTDDFWQVIERIARSKYVISSSLHGVIIAESLGIPAQLFQSRFEHPFKYEDYYRGTGRGTFTMCKSLDAAMDKGGEPKMSFDSNALLGAFPLDVWVK